jgi:hypothetical protein
LFSCEFSVKSGAAVPTAGALDAPAGKLFGPASATTAKAANAIPRSLIFHPNLWITFISPTRILLAKKAERHRRQPKRQFFYFVLCR